MKALHIAQGMEAAEANMKKLHSSELAQVNAIQQFTKRFKLHTRAGESPLSGLRVKRRTSAQITMLLLWSSGPQSFQV